MSAREERVQHALEVLKALQPEELHELFQKMPAAAMAMAVDSVSGTDGGRGDRKGKARKEDTQAPPVELSEGTGDIDDAGSRKSDGSHRPPIEQKRGLPAEFIDSSDLGNTKKQGPVLVEGGDIPDPQITATRPPLDHLQAPDARIHPPPSAPPYSSTLSSAISDQPTTIMSISAFEGAKDCTLTNPVINNVAGNFNSTRFIFDGSEYTKLLTTRRAHSRFVLDVPLTEELRSLVGSSLRASI